MVRRLLPTLLLALLALAPGVAHAQTSERIKNGTPVRTDTTGGVADYPWTVAIIDRGNALGQFCGGTLIAPDVVATAAHCVAGAPPSGMQVLANERKLSEADSDEIYDVDTIHVAPEADGLDPDSPSPTPRYDAAILTLAAPVAGAQVIPPVGAEVAGDGGDDALWLPEADLELMGWGRIETDRYPDVMRHAVVDRWRDLQGSTTARNCQTGLKQLFHQTDMLCALRVSSGKVIDSCDGDSGGPLTTPVSSPTSTAGVKLAGIVSFGSPECNQATVPGAYTRVGAPAIGGFLREFLDADPANDDPQQPYRVGAGRPALTGTLRAGQVVRCAPSGQEAFNAIGTAPEYDLRLAAFDDDGNELTLKRTSDVDPASAAITLELPDFTVGMQLGCELYARRGGTGGYGLAATYSQARVAARPATSTPPPVTPQRPAPAPPPQPKPEPVVVPRDVTPPRTTRISRRCKGARCSFTIRVTDPLTADAPRTGVRTVKTRITTTYRCTRKGKRRTCRRTRTLRTRRVKVGIFRTRTARLRRGAKLVVRVVAIDAAGNAQTKPRRSTFRLRRR